ncbi:DHA2 family efflux MFS transporter permease subunit [Streptomyces sp. 3MP-14]|uniref:DHA2 family efflux MFS transporter permease subunit n=1 Tax=Streptomyces mimosae TaxID=2586635 RepID=A0A5N6AEB5_9ACTN|nr:MULTISPECIES: MDR family MFS transporter [Streptomyces]KAB8167154.1 DHA2 family efflux MFS transporter permease subunit [Streptomyces mimosae]KAB8177095.1 DHA2 family efflux MFS transporter permease subunit [Streptomyces sp. 3MP-14]
MEPVTQPPQPETSTADPAAESIPRTVVLVIGVLLAAAFVMILNETVMGVALPRLMEDLEISAATGQWLTTAFMLTMAVVIPTTGLILKRFTTRAVFLASMTLFTAGTALAAVAPGFPVLLVGRIVQAAGTAVMIPLLITTVLIFVPVARRGAIMGLISIVISVAPAIGPTFSGLILSELSWRWMFLFVLPVAVVALVVGSLKISNITTPSEVRFDLVSIALSAVAFGGLVYGLSSIGEAAEGDTPLPPALPIAVGALALLAFSLRQVHLQRQDGDRQPLLDLRPFRNRAFTVGLVMLLVSMGALFGTLILLPIFLQNVQDLSTLETGLVLLPGGLVMGLIAPLSGRLYDRLGPRPLVVPGAFVVAAALAAMQLLETDSPTGLAIAVHMVLSAGLGLLMTPLMTSSLGSLPADLYSHGSAILNTLQQLAGAAGTALFITVMTRSATSAVEGGTEPIAAQASGIHDAFLCGAVLALVAAGLSFLIRRPQAPAAAPEAGGGTEQDADEAVPAPLH